MSEFRRRLVICVIAFFLAMVAILYWAEWFVDELIQRSTGFRFVYLTPTELMMTYLRVALVGGLVVAAPVILYQIWRFVKPGLLKKERRMFILILFFGLTLFSAGAFFAYQIVLPLVLLFFYGLNTTKTILPMVSIDSYIGFILTTMLTFGVVFELPIVTVLLTRLGLLNPRLLSKNRKYVVIVILVVGALITPPDITSQILVAVPMYALFEVSLLLCRILYRKKIKERSVELVM